MNSCRCFSSSQGNPPASGIRRGIRRQILLFHSFFVPPFFSLRLRRLFLSSRLCGQSPHGHFWQQKRNGPRRFPFHTACGDPQICSCPRQSRTSAETKKVPKDCHVYTWYPLTLLTILNNVCPGSPVGSRNLPVGTRPADISGMSCLSPFPVYRCRIKINYGFILTQYLVSCQLDYTIYPISICLPFSFRKSFFTFFKIFFKFFSLSVSLLYRSAFYRV